MELSYNAIRRLEASVFTGVFLAAWFGVAKQPWHYEPREQGSSSEFVAARGDTMRELCAYFRAIYDPAKIIISKDDDGRSVQLISEAGIVLRDLDINRSYTGELQAVEYSHGPSD